MSPTISTAPAIDPSQAALSAAGGGTRSLRALEDGETRRLEFRYGYLFHGFFLL
jgi:hypothetical protein